MSKIRFPEDMPKAPSVADADKMMIADSVTNEAKHITFDQAKQYFTIEGQKIAPIAPGALPAGPSGETRYMEVSVAGSWTSAGNTFTNEDGHISTLWWNGSTWSKVNDVTLPVAEGTDVLNPTGEDVPKEKAVADYVEPLFNSLSNKLSLLLKQGGFSFANEISANGVIGYARVNPGDSISIRKNTSNGNRFRVGFTRVEPTLGTVVNLDPNFNDENTIYNGVVPNEFSYVVVYINNTTDDFNNYDVVLSKFTSVVNDSMLKNDFIEDIIVSGVNLYDKNSNILNKAINETTNVIYTASGYDLSKPIRVQQGKQYTISGKTMTSSRYVYFINTESSTNIVSKINGQQTFTSPIDGYVTTYAKTVDFDWSDTMQIEEGASATSYQPYVDPIIKTQIKEEFLPEITSPSYGINETIIVDLDRGSLNSIGKYPTYVATKVWKDSEFYKNFRTTKYVVIDGEVNESIKFNYGELSDYIVRVFLFNNKYELISSFTLDNEDVAVSRSCKFLKIHVSRVDNTNINNYVNVKLTANFKGDVYSYNSADSYTSTIKYVIEAQTSNGRDMTNLSISDEAVQYDSNTYYTHSILRLPKNYKPNGEPVRVIYFAHSSSGADIPDFNSLYLPYVQYLVDEGYAVVDVFAWTNKFPNAIQYMNTPTNVACTNAMYKYLSKNYNIRKDGVFVFGKSHGGFQVYSAEYFFNFKILAAASLAGSIHKANKNYGYHDPDRLAVVADLGIDEDPTPILTSSGSNYNPNARAWFRRNASYFHGYIPLTLGSVNFDPIDAFPDIDIVGDQVPLDIEFTAVSKVPVKTWVSPDDVSISYSGILSRKRAVERGAGIFELRIMPSGTSDPHHTVDYAGPMVPYIITKLGVVHSNVPVAWVEMVQFFKRYEI